MVDEDLESFWKVVRRSSAEPDAGQGPRELSAAEAIERIVKAVEAISPKQKRRPSVEIMPGDSADTWVAVPQGCSGLGLHAKQQPSIEAALESTLLEVARLVAMKIREHRSEAEDYLKMHHRENERIKALEGVVEGMNVPAPEHEPEDDLAQFLEPDPNAFAQLDDL